MLPLLLSRSLRPVGAAAAAQQGLRAFASDSALATQSQNPFLKYSSPVPKAIDHSPLLATLPETQVGGGAWESDVQAYLRAVCQGLYAHPAQVTLACMPAALLQRRWGSRGERAASLLLGALASMRG